MPINQIYIFFFRNSIEIRISKRDFEFFGWKFVGGNKIGIFVKDVENHSAAFRANIQKGWKLLEVSQKYFTQTNKRLF